MNPRVPTLTPHSPSSARLAVASRIRTRCLSMRFVVAQLAHPLGRVQSRGTDQRPPGSSATTTERRVTAVVGPSEGGPSSDLTPCQRRAVEMAGGREVDVPVSLGVDSIKYQEFALAGTARRMCASGVPRSNPASRSPTMDGNCYVYNESDENRVRRDAIGNSAGSRRPSAAPAPVAFWRGEGGTLADIGTELALLPR
jgi:hypothetical protein